MKAMTLALALCAPAMLASQQHSGSGGAPLRSPPTEARQFDFLLGQWELLVKPQGTSLAARIHGLPTMVGTWKAWRALDGWGITDELRITDNSGNPRGLVQATRMYDATTKRWSGSSADGMRGAFTSWSAEWRDNAMVVMARGIDADGTAFATRTTFYDIKAGASFKCRQERSTDDGNKWTKTLEIEAKRVAATAPR